MFKNPFSFNGRIRRLEYGISYVLYSIPGVVIDKTINRDSSTTDIVIFVIIAIPMLWFNIAQAAKRCHDRGNSGWWQLIPFYVFWLLFADGEIGDNEYGENPKGLSYDYGDDDPKEEPALPVE